MVWTPSNDSGISPVVGIILMVAVTVILSAVVGMFVFNLSQNNPSGDGVGSAGVTVSETVENGEAKVEIQVVSATNAIRYKVEGNESQVLGATGSTVTLKEGVHYSAGDTITILSNDSETVIQRIKTAGSSFLLNELALHWQFETGSGSTAVDTVGDTSGNIVNAAWTTDAKQGDYAIDFTDSTDYVRNNTTSSLNVTQNITMTAWVYSRGPAANSWNRFVTYDDVGAGTGRNQISLAWDEDDNLYGLYYEGHNTTGWAKVTGQDIPQNTWVHLAGTYDGSTVRFYLNGTQVATATVSTTFDNSAAKFAVGYRSDLSADYINGTVDDVRVYTRPLNASEISTLYRNGQ